MKTPSAFVLLLLAAPLLHAQEPAKKNVLYGHPAELSGMLAVSSLPLDLGLVWLQADYERWLQPGLSAVGGIQYVNLFPTVSAGGDVNLGFYDILAGVRWYPNGRFSGFYLQPQLNYNRVFVSTDDDEESWDLGMNRFGVCGYLGINGKWEVVSVDWNIGLSYLSVGETKIRKKDKVSGETTTTDVTDEADEVVDYVLAPLTPTSSFSIGYMF